MGEKIKEMIEERSEMLKDQIKKTSIEKAEKMDVLIKKHNYVLKWKGHETTAKKLVEKLVEDK